MKSRNAEFDILKGIGIIGVIIGHSIIPESLKASIFLWHMPLFFLASGYFYKKKDQKEYLKSNFKGIIVPYLVTATLIAVATAALSIKKESHNFLFDFGGVLIGAGSHELPMLGDYYVGALWFLLAIFWCRVIYNTLMHITENRIAIATSVFVLFLLTNIAGKYLFIPTDLLQGCNAMLFFYVGHEAKRSNMLEGGIKWWGYAIFAALMVLSYIAGDGHPQIGMVTCYYKIWPLNTLAAISIVYVLYNISKYISHKQNLIAKLLIFAGRYSLVVLCLHRIDLAILNRGIKAVGTKLLSLADDPYMWYNTICHVLIALVGCYIITRLSIVRKLFQIK